MLNELWTDWLRWQRGDPCFRIYGKARPEPHWRIIDIYATRRRNLGSGWPLWDGTCVTWSAEIICVGWDFAESILREQSLFPCSRQHPIEVTQGRIRGRSRQKSADPLSIASASEVLAHECGHTWQALRLGLIGSRRNQWDKSLHHAADAGEAELPGFQPHLLRR